MKWLTALLIALSCSLSYAGENQAGCGQDGYDPFRVPGLLGVMNAAFFAEFGYEAVKHQEFVKNAGVVKYTKKHIDEAVERIMSSGRGLKIRLASRAVFLAAWGVLVYDATKFADKHTGRHLENFGRSLGAKVYEALHERQKLKD